MPFGDGQPSSPEQALWQEMLVRTLQDACLPDGRSKTTSNYNRLDRGKARDFLLDTGPNTQAVICAAGLDWDFFRDGLQKIVAAGWVMSKVKVTTELRQVDHKQRRRSRLGGLRRDAERRWLDLSI